MKAFSRRRAAAFAALLLAAGALGLGAPAQSPKTLVILFTHDLHSRIAPSRSLDASGRPVEKGGFARLAGLIAAERATAGERVLLLDAGDFSMGTLFHTLFMTEAVELRLLGAMGYDASTLGNHEFDVRVDGLARGLRAAMAGPEWHVPLLAANIGFEGPSDTAEAGRAAFRDYPVREDLVLERNGLRVGLFGLFGESAADDSPFAETAVFRDPVESARAAVERLKKDGRADIVVCLSHGGTSSTGRSEDEELAKAVPGIDVIVSGHTHTRLERPIVAGRTIIVSAGAYGEALGKLEIEADVAAGIRMLSYELKAVTAEVPEDPAMAAAVGEIRALVDRGLAGEFPGGSEQVLAESAFDFEPLAGLVNHPGEAALGDLITESFREAVRRAEGSAYRHVHIVVEPNGLIRDSFVRGPLRVEDVFRALSLGLGKDGLYGYPLLASYLTGKEVRRLLEVHASIGPMNGDARLQLSGVRFAFNPHRLIFDRVTRAEILEEDGSFRPLEPKKLYRVVFNWYTAGMVGYVSKASKGILKMEARDAAGKVIDDPMAAAVDADPVLPGVQEIKEWKALAAYLQGVPDRDGNEIPDVPDRYAKPAGRFGPEPSRSPFAILAVGNGITQIALGVAALLLLLVFLLGRGIFRRLRRKRA